MRKLEIYGSITNGILKISYKEKFIEALKLFPDCRVKLVIEKLYKKRSLDQNAYYRGVVCSCFIQGAKDEWGEYLSNDEAHEHLKYYCNYLERVNKDTGEMIREAQTTTTLTTVEFMEYLQKCSAFIKEWFNITVPEPNEQSEMEFIDKIK